MRSHTPDAANVYRLLRPTKPGAAAVAVLKASAAARRAPCRPACAYPSHHPLLFHTPSPDECVSTCFTLAKNLQQFQARTVNAFPAQRLMRRRGHCAPHAAPEFLHLKAVIARPRFNTPNCHLRTPPLSPSGRALPTALQLPAAGGPAARDHVHVGAGRRNGRVPYRHLHGTRHLCSSRRAGRGHPPGEQGGRHWVGLGVARACFCPT